MRIGHLELFVSDTAKSKQFYSDILGFEVIAEQPGGMVWMKLEDAELLLRPGRSVASAPRYDQARAGVALYVKDLQKAITVLQRRGLEFVGDDGAGYPTFHDPDGHWFQLCNPGAI